MTIIEFIDQFAGKNRDEEVLKSINEYIASNAAGFADGLYTDFLVIGNTWNNRFLASYNIDMDEWKQFKKNNKTMQEGYRIMENLLHICFLASYANTGNRMFLDMIFVSFSASKFANYLPYRNSPGYVNKMRYAVEHELGHRSFIKKTGTLFGALQMLSDTFETSAANRKYLDHIKDKDASVLYVLGRIRAAVNDLIKRLKSGFENANKKEKQVRVTSMLVADDGGRMEIEDNSSFIRSMDFLLSDYDPADVDLDIMKLLRIDKGDTRAVFIKIISNKEDDIFVRYANIYIKYYMNNYFESVTTFKNNFINKMGTARLNSPDLKELDKLTMGKILNEFNKLKESGDYDVNKMKLRLLVNRKSFLLNIKKYVILKVRKLATDM